MTPGVEVRDDRRTNPLMIVSPDAVLAWLRALAVEQGYGDRPIRMVQITVKRPFMDGVNVHHEVPELVVMVSNLKGAVEP